MNIESRPSDHPVPWSLSDSWLGVALLALIDAVVLAIMLRGAKPEIAQGIGIVLLELAYLLPVMLIFAWRRIHWRHLGFGGFDPRTMALGCGLLIAGYSIILLHNFILLRLGIDTQGEAILRLIQTLESPVWFFLVGVIFAPFVEEIFFRGFLFQGFRQRYGWVRAALLSAGIFAVAHLDLASLIPTFILGLVLAYLYQRANSLWPGIILHLLVNGSSLCAVFIYTRLPPEYLPSFWAAVQLLPGRLAVIPW